MRISRPTLREGIRALSATGIVRVEHGKGSFITGRPSQARRDMAGGAHAPFTPAILSRLQALLFAAASAQAAARLDQAALDELTDRLSAATGQEGSGAVQELLGALRAHDGDDRLGPLVELPWPEGADHAVEANSGLVGALAARDPGAAFDAAFAALLPKAAEPRGQGATRTGRLVSRRGVQQGEAIVERMSAASTPMPTMAKTPSPATSTTCRRTGPRRTTTPSRAPHPPPR